MPFIYIFVGTLRTMLYFLSVLGEPFFLNSHQCSPNHCCQSTRSSIHKCQGLWEILTHRHINELSQDLSLNHLKFIQTSYLNMNRLRGKRKFKLIQVDLHSIEKLVGHPTAKFSQEDGDIGTNVSEQKCFNEGVSLI